MSNQNTNSIGNSSLKYSKHFPGFDNLALLCTNFDGYNAIFWEKIFLKPPLLMACSKFCLGRRKFGQYRVFKMICMSSHNQFDRPKKSIKFSNFF